MMISADNYTVVNGTYYKKETPEPVIRCLENARITKKRLRLFFGNPETGKDWYEEFDVKGTIGRSRGSIKVPLIINNVRSMGGPAISDNCVVKIIDLTTRQTVYSHPTYTLGEVTIGEPPREIAVQGYKAAVYIDGKNQANFRTYKQAERYVDFLKGERMIC